MGIVKSINVAGQQPPVSPASAGMKYVSDGEASLIAANLALNELVGLSVLPANCVPTDFSLVADDLDSGAGLQFTVGVLNAAGTDLLAGTFMIAASTVGQAGGVARATALPLTFDPANDRIIAAKVVNAPVGALAGKLRGILEYRSESYGR